MQARNAHLNLELLGVRVNRYLSNFYGVTTSALHHGLPTDRLLASWDLESARVQALSRGEPSGPHRDEGRVSIPPQWNYLVKTEPVRASLELERVESELTTAFSKGGAIVGFDRQSSSYVLSQSGRP